LPHGLRLFRELADVVPVVDGSLAEALARVGDGAGRTDEGDVVGADVRGDVEPGPLARHRVVGTVDADE
jgi:hypothetical protein